MDEQGQEILSFVDGYVAWQPGALGAAGVMYMAWQPGAAGAADIMEAASLVRVTGLVRWVAENRSELEVS